MTHLEPATPMIARRSLLLATPILAAPALLLPAAARGQAVSSWSRDAKSGIRLLSGGARGAGAGLIHRAGLEIVMDKGAKTYWRTPGDSGLPPVFDWSGSENLREVRVAWPAPKRLSDAAGQSIGYSEAVVFPLAVAPNDPARPVGLALALDYAICDVVCMPAKGRAALALDPAAPPSAEISARLAHFEARAPRRKAEDLFFALAGSTRGERHARAEFKVRARPGEAVDLFVEGPNNDWALPLPERIDGVDGDTRFRLTFEGAPRAADPFAAEFLATVVASDRALEAPFRLA